MQTELNKGMVLLGDLVGKHIEELRLLREDLSAKPEYGHYPIKPLLAFYEKDVAAKIKSILKAQE